MVCSGVSVLVRVVITITVDTACATRKWTDFQMERGGEGVTVAQVVWRTGVAESGKFFGREGAVGRRNQRGGSADRLVLYCSTFSTPLSRPPAAGPLCPLRWAFIRGHSHRRAGNRRGPEIQCAHTQTSRGKGPEPASRERGPLCLPAEHSSEDTRTSGQRTRVEWKRRS